jgi:hypothetical protein
MPNIGRKDWPDVIPELSHKFEVGVLQLSEFPYILVCFKKNGTRNITARCLVAVPQRRSGRLKTP